jgi:hypothetical protein
MSTVVEDDFPLALVVGAQRSGTTWLQQLLSAHPRIAVGYESNLFSKYLKDAWAIWWSEDSARRRTGGTRGLAAYVTVEEWAALLGSVARGVFRNVLREKPGAELVAEKTPDHALYLPMIRWLFPKVKVIHIIRDGRDVVASLLAAAAKPWGAGWAPSEVAEAARLWVEWVLAAHQDALTYPDLHLEVRYESLRATGPETLGGVYRFLGVPLEDRATHEIYRMLDFEQMRAGQAPVTQILTGEIRREYERAAGLDESTAASTPIESIAVREGDRVHRAALPPEGFYRQGTVGGWTTTLTEKQVQEVMDVAGPLLVKLGYALSTHGLGGDFVPLG